jgi:hypothetical protein
MRVLVACEFSGRVRDAFAKRGHDAWSCDLLPTETPGQHIQGDVLSVLGDGWDLMVAHPPCTYLANSGVRWFYTKDNAYNERRLESMIDGTKFFKALLSYNISKIAIENPIMHGYAAHVIGQKPDQYIQPFWFGDSVQKKTGLWLKNLPLLKPTNIVDRGMVYVDPRGNKHGGAHTMQAKKAYSPLMLLPKSEERWKIRSRTFQGIANAMAEQWG